MALAIVVLLFLAPTTAIAVEKYINDACQFYDEQLQVIGTLEGHTFCKKIEGREYLAVEKGDHLKRIAIKNFEVKSEVWRTPSLVHHDVTISPSKNKIAALGSQFEIFNGQRTRFDTLIVFDIKTGKKISEWSSFDHLNDLKHRLGKGLKPPIRKKDFGRSYYEIFHLNSVDFANEDRLVVSFGRHRHLAEFSLSESLNLETLVEIPGAGLSHAARFFRGLIYVYSNLLDPDAGLSGIVVYDWKQKKFLKGKFLKTVSFYSPTRGNIALDNAGARLLISNSNGEIIELNRKTKSIIRKRKLSYKQSGYPDADFYQLYYAN